MDTFENFIRCYKCQSIESSKEVKGIGCCISCGSKRFTSVDLITEKEDKEGTAKYGNEFLTWRAENFIEQQ